MVSNNRRQFSLGLIAFGAAACSNGIGNNNAAEIDARIEAALSTMYQVYPGAQNLAEKATGLLVMPLLRKLVSV